MQKIKDIILGNKIILALSIAFIGLTLGVFFTKNSSETKLSKLNEENQKLNEVYSELNNENKDLSQKIKSEKSTNEKLSETNNNISKDNMNGEIHESKWEGVYTANQGETSLVLEINKHNAIFTFGPTSNNTEVESGSYYMGKEEINTDTGYIKLTATEWIDKPDGYSMLNLIGIVKGNYMSGVVMDDDNYKQGSISLSRVN